MIGSHWSVVDLSSEALVPAIEAAARASTKRAQLRAVVGRMNTQIAANPRPGVSDFTRYADSDRFVANILANANDAVVAAANDGTIVTWNPAAEALFGRPATEALGTPIEHAAGGDWPAAITALLARLRSEGGVSAIKDTVASRDPRGDLHEVEVVLSEVRDTAGRAIGISCIARDVTEERRLRQQLQQAERLESLGSLASGVAHNFNNLLTGIIGNAELAAEQVGPDSVLRELLESISHEGLRAAGLVRQMLALSGKGGVFRENVQLDLITFETIASLQPEVPPTCQLQIESTPNLPPVHADPVQARHLVLQLVTNAVEAIGDTEGSVIVSTGTVDASRASLSGGAPAAALAPGTCVFLDVVDTGPGMDEATRARIFDPFFSTRFAGRGLGLAAVLGIVRGHGGDIDVRSAPGRGTTVRVVLPAAAN